MLLSCFFFKCITHLYSNLIYALTEKKLGNEFVVLLMRKLSLRAVSFTLVELRIVLADYQTQCKIRSPVNEFDTG